MKISSICHYLYPLIALLVALLFHFLETAFAFSLRFFGDCFKLLITNTLFYFALQGFTFQLTDLKFSF